MNEGEIEEIEPAMRCAHGTKKRCMQPFLLLLLLLLLSLILSSALASFENFVSANDEKYELLRPSRIRRPPSPHCTYGGYSFVSCALFSLLFC